MAASFADSLLYVGTEPYTTSNTFLKSFVWHSSSQTLKFKVLGGTPLVKLIFSGLLMLPCCRHVWWNIYVPSAMK